MKFVKLWDLLRYSKRTTSKTPTRQKLAIWGRFIVSEILAQLFSDDSIQQHQKLYLQDHKGITVLQKLLV